MRCIYNIKMILVQENDIKLVLLKLPSPLSHFLIHRILWYPILGFKLLMIFYLNLFFNFTLHPIHSSLLTPPPSSASPPSHPTHSSQ